MPIEMELQQTASAVSSCSTDEDPPEWDPDELLEYAEKMGQLKERIFEKPRRKTNSIMTESTPIPR